MALRGLRTGAIGNVSVGTSSTVLLSSEQTDEVKQIIFSNEGSVKIYIAMGTAAVMGSGIPLGAGGVFVADWPNIGNRVTYNAISSVGGQSVVYQLGY